MEYDSAIELRDRLLARARTQDETFAADVSERHATRASNIAIGITGRHPEYRVALRVSRIDEGTLPEIDAIRTQARGEVDVAEIGEVVGLAVPIRPLVAGLSVGNHLGDAGTLGCFVKKRGSSTPVFVLSNNHVLARLNFAQPHEIVEQPALFDQSGSGPFQIGEFGEMVPLQPTGNVVDAAIASLSPTISFDARALFGSMKVIAGQRMTTLVEQEPVFKIGKATDRKDGRIKAWGIGHLPVTLGSDSFEFDDQIEIVPDGAQFCDRGDSGSVVLDSSNLVVGLLFGKSLTTEHAYANPIGEVFGKLQIELA